VTVGVGGVVGGVTVVVLVVVGGVTVEVGVVVGGLVAAVDVCVVVAVVVEITDGRTVGLALVLTEVFCMNPSNALKSGIERPVRLCGLVLLLAKSFDNSLL